MSTASRAVLEREQREALGVVEVALAAREPEEQHRAQDEHQADEDLQGYDFHSALLGESAATVTAIVVNELRGISTAHASGDIFPASERPTASVL